MRFFWKNISMKTIVFGYHSLFLAIIGNAKQDTSLVNRVNAMLTFTQVKDLEKVMDYTYPKLFTIVPRETLIAAMKNAFETDEFIIELDSVKVHEDISGF